MGIRKYKLDEECFKTIDSEAKAYWLGFLAADGYICSSKVVGCKLGIKDVEHLKKLGMFFKTDMPIYLGKNNGEFSADGGTSWAALTVTSRIMYNDLSKFFSNKKSSTLEFPVIDDELVRHFIRGYFDGDGSVFPVRLKKYGREYVYCGASILGREVFLQKLYPYLPFNMSKAPIYPNKSVYSLQFSGNRRCALLYDYFYSGASVFLERKKLRFEELGGMTPEQVMLDTIMIDRYKL